MADSTRERTRRQAAREGRRSQPAEPVDEQESTAGDESGSNQSEALAAAKRAAATAAAAAFAGALAGAGKALLERHRAGAPDTDGARSGEDDSDEAVQDVAEPSIGESGAETDERDEDEGADTDGDPAARADEGDSDEMLDDSDGDSDDDSSPADAETQPEAEATDDSDQDSRPQSGAPSSNVAKIVEQARNHARDLLGEEPESVTGVERSNGSWSVTVEVVELHRVPDTTDVLAAYEIVLDDDGNLVRFDRTRRYLRSQVEDVS